MKILFIHTRYLHSAGGEDTTVEAEINLMKSKGHQVQLQLFDNGDMEKGLAGKIKAGINSIYNSASAKTLEKTIHKFQPDIIHVHNFFFEASPSVLLEASKHRVPLVVTVQNFRLICANALLLRDNKVCELCVAHDFPWYGVKYKCYHDSALQSAAVGATAAIHKWIGTWRKKIDLFITPAEFSMHKLLNSSLNIDPAKIKVKRNFIDDPGEGSLTKREPFYLFIGRLSAEKGVDVLLEAWKQLPKETLVIAGDGPEKETLSKKYNNFPNVRFVGKKQRAEVLTLMQKCTALVFPSIWYEGLPLTIVEAFATGTPVLGSSLGAMKEMISHGINGFLFEPGNPGKLAEAVRSFNSMIALGDLSFYAHARKAYTDNYYPEECYRQTIELYRSVIDLKKSNG